MCIKGHSFLPGFDSDPVRTASKAMSVFLALETSFSLDPTQTTTNLEQWSRILRRNLSILARNPG